MSLFGPGIAKGITKQEIHYIVSELKSGPPDTHFIDREIDHVQDLLEMAMDSDSYADRVNHVSQADANEVHQIEAKLKNELTPAKWNRLVQVLEKYLSINRTGNVLGL